METSRTVPLGALRADDLPDIADLFGVHTATHEGNRPFLSLLLGLDANVPQAAQRDDLRWRTQRDEAHAAGVSDSVLAEVDAIVPGAHLDGAGLAIVADAGRVRVVEHLEEPPAREAVHVSSLPVLAPIIDARQRRIPHLVVTVDRRGADLVAVGVRRGQVDEHHESVEQAPGPERKVNAGGWSQRRYEERAENTWRATAASVAEEVVRAVDELGARLVVVAGDVRAVELLRHSLPERVAELVREVDGGRGADGSDPVHSIDTKHLVANVAAQDTVALLRRLEEALGSDARAVRGAGATLEALVQGQVDVLFVHDDADDDRTAWFGAQPMQAATTREGLTAMGATDALEGRVVDVAIRAALGAGSAIRVVPSHGGHLAEGLAALLRWAP